MSSEYTLTIERTTDVPAAKLYRGWTEAALLCEWFCPKPWKVTEARLEPVAGGEFYTLMQGPEGEQMPGHGVYLEVVPEKRIVWTDAFSKGWIPAAKPFMTGVVEFSEKDGVTTYRASARHGNEADMKMHQEMGFEGGWSAAFDQLVELARTL